MNGVSFFAPQIFAGVNALGSGNEGSLIAAVIVNGVQLIATIITVCIVDKVGRRTLLMGGSLLGFVSEIAVAVVFAVSAGKNAINLPYGASIAAIVLVSNTTASAYCCSLPSAKKLTSTLACHLLCAVLRHICTAWQLHPAYCLPATRVGLCFQI